MCLDSDEKRMPADAGILFCMHGYRSGGLTTKKDRVYNNVEHVIFNEGKDMSERIGLDRIVRADRSDLRDVLRELDETRELCRKLDTIIEYNPDGIYVTDGDATAIRINPAFERISGLNRDEMLDVNHRDLEKNGVVARSSALMVVESRKTVTIIHEYLKSGLQALVTSRPVFDEKGNMEMIVSSTRDVTDLYNVRSELEAEREQRLKYEESLGHMQAQLMNSQEMVAVDRKMQNTLYMAARVAVVDSTVLITGETGSGKEGVAKYIHTTSPRKDHTFIPINCSAIPENLVESELFGYEKGAFTGARASGKPGIFELAEGGTVFLDEVGELSLETQAKLLRAIETRQITHVGGTEPITTDIRIVAATNRNLPKMVEQGKFREDLYYRLNVVPIHVPPLRERKDDIIPLVNLFLDEVNKKYGLKKRFTNSAYRVLHTYEWPGNVRELKNTIERLVVTNDKDIIDEHDLFISGNTAESEAIRVRDQSLKERMERVECVILNDAYRENGSVRKAAQALQMPSSTYVRRRKILNQKYKDR